MNDRYVRSMLEAWLLNYAARGRANAHELAELRQQIERMSDRQKVALLTWLEARGALKPRASQARAKPSGVGGRLGVRGFGLPPHPRVPVELRFGL